MYRSAIQSYPVLQRELSCEHISLPPTESNAAAATGEPSSSCISLKHSFYLSSFVWMKAPQGGIAHGRRC